MDPSPITKNVTAHTHFHPPIESGGGCLDFLPLLNCDQQSANDSNAEYPSFKKPRTSQTPMNWRIPALLNNLNMGIPFKNVLCLQFQRGYCTYGDSCHFAHGVGDTHNLLPQRKELINQENWKEDQRIIYSMKLCRKFCNGELCPYGVRCHYLHEPPAKFRKSIATCFGTPRPGGSLDESKGSECKTLVEPSLNVIQVSQKRAFWKTRLCHKWEASGSCPYGTYCSFAHGHAELKLGSQKTEAVNVYTSNTTPTSVMHALSSTTGNETACEKKMQGKKCLVKWKGFEKISHIYADWIDDMPLGKAGRSF